ncbi:MAG: hypothetical protein KJZ59_10800 [Pararhodobacter sp.]|nr:hypothetical protein [Pararhodobacter sp.]
MTTGKANIVTGLLFLAGFMLYGFFLIYLRDFAPGREAWIAEYAVGTHFESRLAHVHGNLFALLNVLIGYLILKLPISDGSAKWASWLGLAGMLMPLGILAEVLLGVPPYLVILGGVSIVAAMIVLGLAIWQADLTRGDP